MSFVVAAPAYVQAAAADLANIGSTISAANAAAATPTTAIMAAGADSVSAELAALFGAHGQMYQALSNQAALFHSQFVQLMNAGGAQYALSEAANASPLASAAGEAGNNTATPGRPISGDVPHAAAGGPLFANAGSAGSGGAGGRGGLLTSAGPVSSLGSNSGVSHADHADVDGPGGPGGLLSGDTGYGALGGAGALAAAGVPLGISSGQSGHRGGSAPSTSAPSACASGMQTGAGGKPVSGAAVTQAAAGSGMDTSLRQSADWSRARTSRDRSAG